jgi:(1->4)-alpha-D-glucan 1-alpha-D-glucosylmutase
LFAEGNYLPLASRGKKEGHVIAFARMLRERIAVIVTGRFFSRLGDLNHPPTGNEVWGDSSVALDFPGAAGLYRDALTGRLIHAGASLPLAEVFAHLPLALLERVKP